MEIASGRGHTPDMANHRSSPSALLRDCTLPCLHCSAQPGVPVFDPEFVRNETFFAARPEYKVHKEYFLWQRSNRKRFLIRCTRYEIPRRMLQQDCRDVSGAWDQILRATYNWHPAILNCVSIGPWVLTVVRGREIGWTTARCRASVSSLL